MHRFVFWLKSRSPLPGANHRWNPLVLLRNGEWQTEVMNGMRLNKEDVMAVGRTKKPKSVHEIKYAILERNGAISIIKVD